MSQRRQEARRAAQERRRKERREARIQQQRRSQTLTRPSRATVAPSAPPARRRTGRPILRYALIGVGVGLVLALAVWLILQQNKPLPGVKYPSNGNAHVEPGEAHGAYFSNPPTSGWHFAAVPRPGIYTTPIPPEGVGHFLEHGGIWVLYTCDGGRNGCPDVANQLEDIVRRATDRKKPVAVAPYPAEGRTPPAHRINVVAWQYLLSLDDVDRGQINNFIDRHICRYNPEGGPYCAGVRGKTGKVMDAGEAGFNAVGVAAGATAVATVTPAATPTPAQAGPTPVPVATGTPAR